MDKLKQIIVYTDGACLGNPGPGGYGVILENQGERKEKAGGFRLTTNNRMEIMAAVIGLESLKEKSKVTVVSDSQYLVKAISEGWAKRWRENGWMRTKKDKALNPDLWDRLLKLCDQHEVEFKWVKGHNNHIENERCDRLSVEAASKSNLQIDNGYENPTKNSLF